MTETQEITKLPLVDGPNNLGLANSYALAFTDQEVTVTFWTEDGREFAIVITKLAHESGAYAHNFSGFVKWERRGRVRVPKSAKHVRGWFITQSRTARPRYGFMYASMNHIPDDYSSQ